MGHEWGGLNRRNSTTAESVLPAAADFGFGEPIRRRWLVVAVGTVGRRFGGGVPPVFNFSDGGRGWRDGGWLFVEDFFFGFFDDELGLFDRGRFGARFLYLHQF